MQDKIERYKSHLSKSLWELRESALLMCGVTEFRNKHLIFPPELSGMLGIESFDFLPDVNMLEKSSSSAINQYSYELLERIEGAIDASSLWSFRISHAKHKFTYLFEPAHLLGYILTQDIGLFPKFKLPLPLLTAADLYPLECSIELDKKKDVQRDAAVHFYQYSNPSATQIEISDKLIDLKVCAQKRGLPDLFGFIFGSRDSKNRMVAHIKKIRDKYPGVSETVPGVIENQEHTRKFNYKRLQIALEVIANILFFNTPDLKDEVLYENPLISCYFLKDNPIHNKIVKWYLNESIKKNYALKMPDGKNIRHQSQRLRI